jgi:hypothetical protein
LITSYCLTISYVSHINSYCFAKYVGSSSLSYRNPQNAIIHHTNAKIAANKIKIMGQSAPKSIPIAPAVNINPNPIAPHRYLKQAAIGDKHIPKMSPTHIYIKNELIIIEYSISLTNHWNNAPITS